jgi:hypothetical protein
MSLGIAALICIAHIVFISPFNILQDEIDETEDNMGAITEESDKAENPLNQTLEDLAEDIREEQRKAALFNDIPSATITILNIKNGIKKELNLKVGDSIEFDAMTLKLENCKVEAADFYDKLHIGSVRIDERRTVLSNNMTFAVTVKDKYLFSITC